MWFYEAPSLSDEVECHLEDGAIVIRPLHRTGDEFSVDILKDLVSEGSPGEQLVKGSEAQHNGRHRHCHMSVAILGGPGRTGTSCPVRSGQCGEVLYSH